MKKILHLAVSGPLPGWANELTDLQKKNADAEIELFQLTPENAAEALEKIFAADSICVWPPV